MVFGAPILVDGDLTVVSLNDESTVVVSDVEKPSGSRQPGDEDQCLVRDEFAKQREADRASDFEQRTRRDTPLSERIDMKFKGVLCVGIRHVDPFKLLCNRPVFAFLF